MVDWLVLLFISKLLINEFEFVSLNEVNSIIITCACPRGLLALQKYFRPVLGAALSLILWTLRALAPQIKDWGF
jgi:hypothetical protein